MAMLPRAAARLSQVLARAHRWYPAAWVLTRVPLAALDSTSVGRLRYALMMANRDRPAQSSRLLDRLLRANRTAAPRLRLELAAMATATGRNAAAADLLQEAKQAPETADAAGKLLRTLHGSMDGSLHRELGERLHALRVPTDIPVTLVPVSGRYLQLWHLWLQQVRRHVRGDVVAMAMDDAAVDALRGQPGVHVVDVRDSFSWGADGRIEAHTRGVLWYLRVLLLQLLVGHGHTVLVLDLDAVPVGDVQPLLDSLPSANVIAQQDHSLPRDVDRTLGFVLCCGVMVWRPGASTVALLEQFAAETAKERDDQLALNHMLVKHGLSHRSTTAGGMEFQCDGVRFASPDPSVVSRTETSGTVIRHFHQTGQSDQELRAALGIRPPGAA